MFATLILLYHHISDLVRVKARFNFKISFPMQLPAASEGMLSNISLNKTGLHINHANIVWLLQLPAMKIGI